MYYKVSVVRGHQGSRQYGQTIMFAEKANSVFEAMKKAQRHAGVKHTLIPHFCVQITEEEYCELMKVSAYERAKVKSTNS